MYLTPTEAQHRVCCGPQFKSIVVNNMCVASMCMAWRWQADTPAKSIKGAAPDDTPAPLPERRGWCGLAASPA
jgi:hypothetical protein